MNVHMPRRRFLAYASTAAVVPAGLALAGTESAQTPGVSTGPTRPYLPAQDPDIVRQIVGVSHRDLEAVRALIERQPALVNAGLDWGFGDWESPIDAASHTGQVEIALYLIEKGARPTIFTLTMLGHLDAVKAALAAFPGIQKTRGPHGLTLLSHARAGGDNAKPVLDYLTSLGDADPRYPGPLLAPETAAPYLGVYSFGPHETDRLEIVDEKGKVGIRRTGGFNRTNLFAVEPGEPHTFHPSGAPGVRIRFAIENNRATSVSLADPDVYLTATRVPD